MILGLDIGGTSVKLALMERDGTIVCRDEASTSFDQYATPVLQTVKAAADFFLLRSSRSIEGIAVSATGQIDTALGKVIGTNGKIPNYEGAEIKAELEQQFKVPVRVLNDANAAALGECFLGCARGVQNAVMVTIGTGIGGGIVLNGRILNGSRGIAGEIGHFTLYADGLRCACGKTGCFESYASTTALVRQAERMLGESNLNGRILFERAAKGEEQVLHVLNRWTDDIAQGISGLVHIFNPETVIIGGGVSTQEELLLNPLRKKILSQVMPRFGENLRIERASLGNDAGVIGALRYWLDN